MKSRWERDTEDSEEDMLTDEGKGDKLTANSLTVVCFAERQKGFKEWRKAHYNEYAAVQRARELMKV